MRVKLIPSPSANTVAGRGASAPADLLRPGPTVKSSYLGSWIEWVDPWLWVGNQGRPDAQLSHSVARFPPPRI